MFLLTCLLIYSLTCLLRPSLHLPRAPCDNFVCDFPYGFWDIVCGCGLRRTCLHNTRLSCDFLCGLSGDWSGQIRTEAARRLNGSRAILVQSPHSLRKLSMGSYGARTTSVQAVRRYVYGDDVDHNMAGSILRYDLKLPRDSLINSCIRVSKCPMVTLYQ